MIAAIAPGLSAQTGRLNPTVKVLPKPVSVIPTDCDTGLAPAPPRPTLIAEASEPPAVPSVAPSADLRTRLRRVQAAAENGDHDTFKSALAEARSATAAHPGGGEKQAAGDVLQVYTDLERLWDFSFSSSTGSFFDESSENGAIVSAMRKYPEFPRSVADATMTIRGVTVYPTRETRQILVGESAKRLSRLGVRTPARVVQETPRVTEPPRRPAPQPQPQPQRPTQRQVQPQPRTARPRIAQSKPAPQPKSSPPARKSAVTPPVVQPRATPSRPPVKIAQATPKPAVRREEPSRPQPQPPSRPQPQPQPQPQPVAPKPVAVQPVAPRPQPQPVIPPIVSAPATTTTLAPPPTTTTAASETTSSSQTATTMTAATESTDTTATTAPTNGKPGGMNMTFAIILIVVGIGVLIVLFRASD